MGKAIVLQERDWETLRGLLEARLMRMMHIAEIYFEGRGEMAKKRIQLLKATGLIAQYPRLPSEPSLLRISPSGLRLLENEGILADYPGISFKAHLRRLRVAERKLRHETFVMDCVADAFRAVREGCTHRVEAFCAWPRRIGVRGEQQPDAAIYVRTGSGEARTIYVEADCSTESTAVLLAKVRHYSEEAPTAGLLFVFQTDERVNSVEASIRARFPLLRISRSLADVPLSLDFLYLSVVEWSAETVR